MVFKAFVLQEHREGRHKPCLCCNTHVIIDVRPHNPVFKNMQISC